MNIKRAFRVHATGFAATTAADTWAEESQNHIKHYCHFENNAVQPHREIRHTKRSWFDDWFRGVSLLVDVKSLEEYAACHAKRSYSIPYPRSSNCEPKTEEESYWEVDNGETNKLTVTLCRTGRRSVAGTHPAKFGFGDPKPKSANVRNIRKGFVGRYKYAYDGSAISLNTKEGPFALGFNDSGKSDGDMAVVYKKREDSNPDKDGWRYFQQLPWTTTIQHQYAYRQDPWQHSDLTLTPVE
jgi:hypothetical protein